MISASAPARSTSFHAETTSSAKPRRPTSHSSAIARLWRGRTRMNAKSAHRGTRSLIDDGDQGHPEVDDPHVAREQLLEGAGTEQAVPLRPRLASEVVGPVRRTFGEP